MVEDPDYKEFLDTDWQSNRARILLFADIMGFKAKVASEDHTRLVREFRDFIKQLTKLMEPLEIGRHLRLTMFSDSIVIGADSCTLKNFNLIVKAAAILMCLCHKFSLPINGCISCGNLTFDEQIQTAKMEAEIKGKRKIQPYMPLFIGESVVNAHLLNEDLFCYGIVLHKSAEALLKASNAHEEKKFHHPFYFIPIPLKSGGSARLYYLSWTEVATATNVGTISNKDITEWLLKLEEVVGQRPRAYIQNTRLLLNDIQKE